MEEMLDLLRYLEAAHRPPVDLLQRARRRWLALTEVERQELMARRGADGERARVWGAGFEAGGQAGTTRLWRSEEPVGYHAAGYHGPVRRAEGESPGAAEREAHR